MNWFLSGYMLKEEEDKQNECLTDCSTGISGCIPSEAYTPKWVDRFIKKHNLPEDIWACMFGLFIGLLPLLISVLFFKICGIW